MRARPAKIGQWMSIEVDLAPGVRDGGEADMRPWRRPSALNLQAGRETLAVWEVETVKENPKDSKIYAYRMTSWCEGDKTRNANLGSTRKRDAQAVL